MKFQSSLVVKSGGAGAYPLGARNRAETAGLTGRFGGQYEIVTVATATSKYLRIYLNDHLAGSTTGTELARRIAQENEGTPLGAVMSELAREIGEDREELRRVMSELGAPENPAKVGMGWAMEKAARLKPNGHVRGYSPLSPFIEVESLSLGIEGKRLLWLALKAVEADRLGEDRLQRLADRAQSQRERLEPLRIDACRRMVAEG